MAYIFPLRERQLIRGATEHLKAGLGVACDYVADYVSLFTPVAGIMSHFTTTDGGLWLRVRGDDGLAWEFAHLSRYMGLAGRVGPATEVGITGNSGTVTTGPHLHLQIKDSRGRRLDPEEVLHDAILPGIYPLGDFMTEDDKVRLLLPQMVTYWENHHDRLLSIDDYQNIETEIRKILRGEISHAELLARWSQGN